MQLAFSGRIFAQAIFVAWAIGAGFGMSAPVQAALLPAEGVAEAHKPAAMASRFTLIAPPIEGRIDIDEAHSADNGQMPLALWLFGTAAMFLPASGVLAAVRRHRNHPAKF